MTYAEDALIDLPFMKSSVRSRMLRRNHTAVGTRCTVNMQGHNWSAGIRPTKTITVLITAYRLQQQIYNNFKAREVRRAQREINYIRASHSCNVSSSTSTDQGPSFSLPTRDHRQLRWSSHNSRYPRRSRAGSRPRFPERHPGRR